MRLFLFGILLVLSSGLSPAWAQVDVSAQVDRTTVSPGESLQLQVKVSGGSGEVDLSPIVDFKVRTQGTSSSVQFINGLMSKEVSYNYLLVPQGGGKLTIPPLTVTVNGQPYRSDPITVTVTDQPRTGNSGPSTEKEVWVTAELSEVEPFAGQQITYTFRFYRAVAIDDAKFRAPGFNGFSANEVQKRHSYRKVINGREHVVTEVYFILTPLEKGELTIDPAVVHVGVIRHRRSRQRSPFEDFFNRGIVEPRAVQTEPLKIAVRPLPPLQSPKTFSGLVGRFEMAADIESTDLKVGDSTTLTITLKGKGNIIDAQAPLVELPAAFKRYTDNPEEEILVDRTGISGKKVFRIALVPVDPGRYTIAPIDVIYFDAEKEAYRTLRSDLPPLAVAPAAASRTDPLMVTPGSVPRSKKKVAFTGRDILPPKESLTAIQSSTPVGWPIFLFFLTAPASVYGLVTMVQRIKRPDTRASAVMKVKAHQALKLAKGSTGDAFLKSLYQALTAAIFAAAGRTGEALTWKEAEALLMENRFSKEDAAGAAKLLSEVESIKFGGKNLATDQHRTLLDRTRTMVRKLAP